jgi:hypothetical protein
MKADVGRVKKSGKELFIFRKEKKSITKSSHNMREKENTEFSRFQTFRKIFELHRHTEDSFLLFFVEKYFVLVWFCNMKLYLPSREA